MNFDVLFDDFRKLRIAVVGDVMLDTYWWGKVDRISPEAPVPVIALDHKEYRIGGAGNVALNTVSLGAETTLFSVVGDDDDADMLLGLLQDQHVDTKYIIKSRSRITTNKIRVVSKSQQMLRVDSEVTHDIVSEDEEVLLSSFTSYVKRYQPAVVIFEDYDKGILTPTLIKGIIAVCKEHGVVTTVDPKRAHFFAYEGVDIFKPNLKEVREALHITAAEINEATLREIHAELHKVLQHKVSLITLSEKGVFFQKGSQSRILPAHLRNIADVSGAGDTVIAVASMVYAQTKDIRLMAGMANIAGGLVCEAVGTAAISREMLEKECHRLLGGNE
ncbi:bifunctional heptose 7-phosphate kinase/heptose 1-phosphate adenyltransferase [Filimonas effusa]|uniref:Carbohydrate kinase n=1 Tax=Filimonas effusa TaxID=2508721 RepID=A0A4Q1D0S1_9BACT|nr:PfkB family carbohydrate kinase [Filimonas effusa]RXK80542.1 carbohydrate kinase [Filimonas effusa]